MTQNADRLVFFETPEVEYGSNRFVDVPIVLQYEDAPLLEVVKAQSAGFTTQFSIFNRDGVYLAKAVGSQLHPTEAGRKSNLSMRHPDHATICELDGQVLFELRRKEAAALRTEAELFTPDGRFLKTNSKGMPANLVQATGSQLQIHGMTMEGNLVDHCRIGILIRRDGSLTIGVP